MINCQRINLLYFLACISNVSYVIIKGITAGLVPVSFLGFWCKNILPWAGSRLRTEMSPLPPAMVHPAPAPLTRWQIWMLGTTEETLGAAAANRQYSAWLMI